jgi:hypothetical protein
MADLTLKAGILNVQIYKGNTRDIELDWNIDLTGHIFTARIVNALTDVLIVQVPIVLVNLGLGQITLKITDVVALATPVGKHKLLLDWESPGLLKRTVIAGSYVVNTP